MTMSSVFVATFLAQSSNAVSEFDIRVSAPTTAGVSIPDSVRTEIQREVAMPYLLLAPISAGFALAFRDARGQGVRRAVVASFAFGALGGFRQDLLLFPRRRC